MIATNGLKRYLGFVWMLIGPLAIFLLLQSAARNIDAGGKADINKPLPWMIVILVFTPIAIGLTIFGWYSWKGAYDEEPESSRQRSASAKP